MSLFNVPPEVLERYLAPSNLHSLRQTQCHDGNPFFCQAAHSKITVLKDLARLGKMVLTARSMDAAEKLVPQHAVSEPLYVGPNGGYMTNNRQRATAGTRGKHPVGFRARFDWGPFEGEVQLARTGGRGNGNLRKFVMRKGGHAAMLERVRDVRNKSQPRGQGVRAVFSSGWPTSLRFPVREAVLT